ncbi:hypothetical protein like AT5G19485 [Hibiscus trionum]|uniref:Nucleotidyl transferase domain-containing protein n=1 Tax=Hibiscus trionum TaxID=183268 RepID=A0A9W7GYA5_HIBTR|nr:hypothetical protein like AT5G19485 [Hibiscus trionum]
MDFQLVVLVGGNSRNLTPFVSMVPVVNRLVLYYVLHQMEQSNLKNLVVLVEGKDTSFLVGGWISKIFTDGLHIVIVAVPKDIRAVKALTLQKNV